MINSNFSRFNAVRTLLTIAGLSITTASFADHNPMKRHKNYMELPHVATEIKVDATMNEDVWDAALKVELNYETHPAENTKPPVKTEAYLFENGEKLFVGFKAYDPNPSEIRDYLSDRDHVWESDIVGIKFDTFGESRKAFQFFVNAIGVQADSTQEDFRGDDSSWDAIWDSHGRVTDFGYVVEMAIPFKALRFPESDKEQNWGVEILRFYPRDKRHRIANTPVDRDISCRICQFDQLVGFANIKPSKNLQLTPTLVLGRSDSRDVKNTNYWDKGDFDSEVGLDVRWGVTQDIVLNATFNPDFSQVEADSAQLDVNNTFSLFLQEKRPFFLEGTDYFNTHNQLVHTRVIEAPDFGGKVTGQVNGHSFGVFYADDHNTNFLVPGNQGSGTIELDNQKTQNQVLRYSYDLGDKNNIGILMTNRSGENGYSNQVTSIDGKYWFDENHSISYQLMSSSSEYSVEMAEIEDSPLDINNLSLSDTAYTARFNHNSRNWWGYIGREDWGKDFRADLGFIGRVDFDKTVIGLGHIWHSENKDNWWNSFDFGGDWDVTHDNSGEKLEEELEAHFNLQGALQSYMGTGIGKRRRLYDTEYFNEKFWYVWGNFKPFEGLTLGVNAEIADQIDFSNVQLGESFRFSPWFEWQMGQHWNMRINLSDVDFDVDAGDLFDAQIINGRLTYQIDARSFIRFTLQGIDINFNSINYPRDSEGELIDSTYKKVSSQMLYSYKINPRTLFFAGYSDKGYQDDDLTKVEKDGRSIFMKFSYAWQL